MRKEKTEHGITSIVVKITLCIMSLLLLFPLTWNHQVKASMSGFIGLYVAIYDRSSDMPLSDEISSVTAKVYKDGQYLFDAEERQVTEIWKQLNINTISNNLRIGSTYVVEFSIPENYIIDIDKCDWYPEDTSKFFKFTGNKLIFEYTEEFQSIVQRGGMEPTLRYYNAPAPKGPTDIKDCQITLSKSVYTYTGKGIEAKIQIKDGTKVLKEGKDYNVYYSNCIYPGTARIDILGRGDYTGYLEKNFTIKLATPKLSSAKSAGFNSINVSWDKVSGAKTYNLYYKGGTLKTWKLVKSGITGTSYTHKSSKLLTGTKYTYTVRAVFGIASEGISDYNTKGVSAKPALSKGNISKISAVAQGLKVTWKKVSGSSGYIIQRLDNGKWTNIKTIRKGTTVVWTDTSVKIGKSYSYRIRAYRTINSKKVYGSYSDSKLGIV